MVYYTKNLLNECFEVGKKYTAEWDITGHYYNNLTLLGTFESVAICIKRTAKFATFKVFDKNKENVIEIRGRIKYWDTINKRFEYVILKKAGYKDITVKTWYYDVDSVDTDSYIKGC